MAFCREKNQKLLFEVGSLLKFRKLLPLTFPLRAGDRWFRACGVYLRKFNFDKASSQSRVQLRNV